MREFGAAGARAIAIQSIVSDPSAVMITLPGEIAMATARRRLQPIDQGEDAVASVLGSLFARECANRRPARRAGEDADGGTVCERQGRG